MFDFIKAFSKFRKTSHSNQVSEETVEQKWNPKLHIYDTPLAGCEQRLYHGAGMSHYMDALMELATEEGDYTCTKKEMRDFLIINRRVYQYHFRAEKIDLVPEPQNIHDLNAVKLILDGHHVGYIRAEETPGLVELFDSDQVKRVQVVIEGGKYKILLGEGSFFDGSEPLSDFKFVKDEAPISIKIYLDVLKA